MDCKYILIGRVEMGQTKRDELHRVWMEVTGSAVVRLHRTDGYKGSIPEERNVSLIKPNVLKKPDDASKS